MIVDTGYIQNFNFCIVIKIIFSDLALPIYVKRRVLMIKMDNLRLYHDFKEFLETLEFDTLKCQRINHLLDQDIVNFMECLMDCVTIS